MFKIKNNIEELLRHVRRNDYKEVNKVVIIALSNRDRPEFKHVLDNHDLFCDISYWIHEMIKDECWDITSRSWWAPLHYENEEGLTYMSKFKPKFGEEDKILFIATIIWEIFNGSLSYLNDKDKIIKVASKSAVSSKCGRFALRIWDAFPLIDFSREFREKFECTDKYGSASHSMWSMTLELSNQTILHGYDCSVRPSRKFEIEILESLVRRIQ